MDITSVWQEYKKTKNQDLRNFIIEHYVNIVKIVAGKLYNSLGGKVSMDDLYSAGILGLIDSVDKFDIDRDLKFETYATFRIRGAILDDIRALDWVPRSIRSKSKKLETAVSELSHQYNRLPTTIELSKHIGISEDEVKELLQETSVYNVISLEDFLTNREDDKPRDIKSDSKTPEDEFMDAHHKEMVVAALNQLKERDKLLMSLYYYEDLTYKEIAELLGISESRVSQIHSKLVLELREILKKMGW